MPTPNRIDIWAIARHLLSLMSMALGSPAALATERALTRRYRREVLDWLEPFEALMRKALLIDAAALARPSTHVLPPKRVSKAMIAAWQKPRRTQQRTFDQERPAQWRVSFKVTIPRDPLKHKKLAPQLAPFIRPLGATLVRDIWREREARGAETQRAEAKRKARENRALKLAQRYEALRRVIFDPAPHAERLARRLWRQRGAAPFTARRLAEAPLPRRLGFFDQAFIAIAPLLAAAPDAFWPFNSS